MYTNQIRVSTYVVIIRTQLIIINFKETMGIHWSVKINNYIEGDNNLFFINKLQFQRTPAAKLEVDTRRQGKRENCKQNDYLLGLYNTFIYIIFTYYVICLYFLFYTVIIVMRKIKKLNNDYQLLVVDRYIVLQ